MTSPLQLLVLAKEPLPGLVKTRLMPDLSAEQAAQVAFAALSDTLDAVRAVPVSRRVLVLQGSSETLPCNGFDVVRQSQGDLGDRLANAFQDAWDGCHLPMLLIGMDTPHVAPALLADAARQLLAGRDGVLGLARDGGWWALGLHRPVPGCFDQVPMSTDSTGRDQRARLSQLGVQVSDLPVLTDVDQLADIALVAAQMAADSAFARVARDLALVAA